MRRKSVLLALGLVLLIAASVTFVVGILVKHEPQHYRDLAIPVSAERQQRSGEFQTQFFNLMNGIKNRDRIWEAKFTSDQINCYFQEDFARSGGGDANLPDGCHDPRVVIEPERLRLSFRYGEGFWSTLVTLDLKIWLVKDEVNVIGVEILGLRAGALPVSPQLLLDGLTEAARNANMDVNWFRDRGNPVAILRYQPNSPIPTLLLQRLEFQQGQLVIVGQSPDTGFGRVALKPSF